MGSAAIGQFRVPPSCRLDRGTGLMSFWPTTLKALFAWQAEASTATASRGTSADNSRWARVRGPLLFFSFVFSGGKFGDPMLGLGSPAGGQSRGFGLGRGSRP